MRIVLPVFVSSMVRTRCGRSPQRSQFRVGCDLGAGGGVAGVSPSLTRHSSSGAESQVQKCTLVPKASLEKQCWLRLYFGGCNPGELAHSSIWDAVSAIRAFLNSASCSGPGRSLEACAFNWSEKIFSRSLRESVCLIRRRRCMTQPRAYGS
jgi:hypothetical protein